MITWAVSADFDRDGVYEYDLTGDIEAPGSGIVIDRGFGKDGIYQVSKVSITVTNRSGRYVFDNSASDLYGKLKAGVPIKVEADGTYTLWTGYIQSYRMSGFSAGSVPTCTFECTDVAGFLMQQSPLNVLVGTRTTREAYEAVAEAAGLLGTDYLFTGIQSLPLHWVRMADALTAMAQIQQSEMGGQWFVDALGRIRGQSRNTRLGINVAQTWGDGTDIYPVSGVVEVTDEDVISKAAVQANVFVADADEQVIFEFSRNASNPVPDSILIEPGATYGPVSLDYPSPALTVSALVATTDYTANSAIDGSGTDMTANLQVTNTEEGAGFSLALTNTHATDSLYVTKFQKRGIASNYVPDRPIFTYSLPIPGDKTERGITVQLPFADDSGKPRDFTVQLVRTYRHPYPRLRLSFLPGNAAAIAAMLSVELGDLIRYRDTDLTTLGTTYSNDWWYVDHIRTSAPPTMAGQTFQIEVELIPSYLFRNLDAIVYDQFERDANAESNVIEDGGFETGVDAGWGSFQGTLSQSSTQEHLGSNSMKVARASGVLYNAFWAETLTGNTAGRTFTGRAWVYGEADSIGDQVDLIVRENGGSQARADTTVSVTLTAGWQSLEATRVIVESDRTAVELVIERPSGATAGEYFYVDDAELFEGGLGTSTSYDAWAGSAGFDIEGGYAVANSDSAQLPVMDLGEGVTDAVVEVLLSEIGSGDEVGLTFRYLDANHHYRFYIDAGSNEAILEKVVSGTTTELSSPAYTVGTSAELRVMHQAGRIRCYVDELLVIDTEDAPLFAGTKCGLFARNASGTTKFNEFYGQGLNGSIGVAEVRMPEITPMPLRRPGRRAVA